MKIKLILFFFLASLLIKGQNLPVDLKQFESNKLLNPKDSICFNISGEWTGEEIQYDPTQSYIKVKFRVEFKLKQEGNIISGTTFIRDKFRGSYGYMKIRGVVIGNKFHFEEYEVSDEKFFEKNVEWCLRSGILSIEKRENKYYLVGLEYNGYTSTKYEKCTDYAKMILNSNKQLLKSGGKAFESSKKELAFTLYPNPSRNTINIKYKLEENSSIQIDIFDLSGKYIISEKFDARPADEYTSTLDISNYIPGVYLVRMTTNYCTTTTQIIKSE
jgi:hypothetical protein